MKRIYSVLLAVLMVSVLATTAACGNKNTIKNPGSDYEVNLDIDYETEGSLKIGVTIGAQESDIIGALIEEYNQVYPNVKITVEGLTEPYNNTLITYYQADSKKPGTMPDILLSNSEDMHSPIGNGILLDIQPYVNAATANGSLNLDDFYSEMWRLGQKKLGGDQYLIPRSSDRVVTHINQKIFTDCFGAWKKEDLPFTPIEGTYVPANGWTWGEFLDTCAALRNYYDSHSMDKLYLIDGYLSWGPVYDAIFKSCGAEIMSPETGEIKVDSPATKKALDLMKELVDKKYCAPFASMTQANYEGGQGAMMFHSAYATKWIRTLGEEYNLTTFPLIGETPHIGTGVPGYGIYGRSDNRDLAWTFLSFMLTADGQNAMARGGMSTNPIRKDMADPLTNVWGEEISKTGVNMEAYSFGTQYCTPVEYYTYYETKKQSDILLAGSTLVIESLGSMSYADAIAKCIDSLEYLIS